MNNINTNQSAHCSEDDLSHCLTPAQKRRLIYLLRADLGMKPLTKRAYNRAANITLKKWAAHYKSTDAKEIRRDTGNLQSSMIESLIKNAGMNKIYQNIENGYNLSDDDYGKLQLVINSMSQYNRLFIRFHYLKRGEIMAKLAKIYDDKNKVNREFYKKLGTTKSTYNRHLNDSRYEFMIRGGLN